MKNLSKHVKEDKLDNNYFSISFLTTASHCKNMELFPLVEKYVRIIYLLIIFIYTERGKTEIGFIELP